MEFLQWRLQQVGDTLADLPVKLITRRPFDANGLLDPTTALLLPSAGVEPTLDPTKITLSDVERSSTCLGLWMGTGFPVLARSATPGNTTEWITNFPPMGMYEQTFSDSLNEVGLGAAREHKHLKALQELGFRVMLALHAGQNLETASDLPADAALLVIRSDGDLKKIRDGYLDVVRNVLGADIPLVMHGGPERHLPNNPQALGADAVLDMPR